MGALGGGLRCLSEMMVVSLCKWVTGGQAVRYVYPYGRGHQIIIAVCLGNKCFPEVLCLWRDPGCELLAIAADFHD